MKLRNDKEINALFALYKGVQWSPLHQPSKKCTNQATTASSHRIRRTHRNLLLRYPPTDVTDAHRLGGYGIPAIPTHPPNYLPTEPTESTEVYDARYSPTDCTLSLQKNATQSHKLQNDQGKTMIAKDSFVPLL